MPKIFFKVVACSLVCSVAMLGVCTCLMGTDNKQLEDKKGE